MWHRISNRESPRVIPSTATAKIKLRIFKAKALADPRSSISRRPQMTQNTVFLAGLLISLYLKGSGVKGVDYARKFDGFIIVIASLPLQRIGYIIPSIDLWLDPIRY